MRLEEADPKGLVRESYRIEGITGGECRSIFIDWALSLSHGQSEAAALQRLLAEYALDAPDHPMSRVLSEGLDAPTPPRRRGGKLGRSAKG